MRDTIRDFMIAIGAAAALFAAFQSWTNGQAIAALTGRLDAMTEVVTAHVNAAGLHR